MKKLIIAGLSVAFLMLSILFVAYSRSRSIPHSASPSISHRHDDVTNVRLRDPSSSPSSQAPQRVRVPAGSPHNFSLTVVDVSERAVAGAKAVLSTAGVVTLLGYTDDTGRLSALLEERASSDLVVAADGYGIEARSIQGPFPLELRVRLSSEYSAFGIVVDDLGRPVKGLTVVAWPVEMSTLVSGSNAELRLCPQALTDQNGTFRIHGLSSHATHQITAGGLGYIHPDALIVHPNSRSGIRLEVKYLFGVRLLVLGGNDNRPVTAPELGTIDCTHYRTPLNQFTPIAPGHPSAALSGPIRELMNSGYSFRQFDVVKLYAVTTQMDEVIPVAFRLCVAGYSPYDGELLLLPVRGILAEQSISLEPACSFGNLEVRLRGLSSPERMAHNARQAPLYIFGRNRDTNEEYTFRLTLSSVTELNGLVPAGTTDFQLLYSDWQSPRWDESDIVVVEIGSDQDNRLEFDLSGYGGVEIALHDSVGQVMNGPALFEVHDISSGKLLRYVEFARAPYVFFGLPDGDFFIATHRRYSSTDSHAQSTHFHVVPGSYTSVLCVP